jgi:hypothetical protein
MPAVVFTDPQVASVGLTEAVASALVLLRHEFLRDDGPVDRYGFASSIRTWQYRSANSTRLRPTSRPRRTGI